MFILLQRGGILFQSLPLTNAHFHDLSIMQTACSSSLTSSGPCTAADPLAVNDDVLTPLDLARNRGHLSVVRMIEVMPFILAAPQNVIVDVHCAACFGLQMTISRAVTETNLEWVGVS